MTPIHAAQAIFFAKQMVPCAAGLGVSTVLSEYHSVSDYMHTHRLAFKIWEIELNHKWILICQSFSTKLPTIPIHQSFYPPSFLLYSILA